MSSLSRNARRRTRPSTADGHKRNNFVQRIKAVLRSGCFLTDFDLLRNSLQQPAQDAFQATGGLLLLHAGDGG